MLLLSEFSRCWQQPQELIIPINYFSPIECPHPNSRSVPLERLTCLLNPSGERLWSFLSPEMSWRNPCVSENEALACPWEANTWVGQNQLSLPMTILSSPLYSSVSLMSPDPIRSPNMVAGDVFRTLQCFSLNPGAFSQISVVRYFQEGIWGMVPTLTAASEKMNCCLVQWLEPLVTLMDPSTSIHINLKGCTVNIGRSQVFLSGSPGKEWVHCDEQFHRICSLSTSWPY